MSDDKKGDQEVGSTNLSFSTITISIVHPILSFHYMASVQEMYHCPHLGLAYLSWIYRMGQFNRELFFN